MPHGRRSVLEHILHGGLDAALAVLGNTQGRADPVGSEEAHALQILAQPVGILPDHRRGALAVELADLHRQGGGHAVGLQEHHGLPGGLLLAEGLGNLNPALLAHLGDLLQPFGMLAEDGEGLLAEVAHDQLGRGGAHALDQPAAQVPLDTQEGGGLHEGAAGALQLPAVLRMLHPFSGEHRLLALGQLGQGAHHGDLAPPHAGHDHAVAIVRVAVHRPQDAGLHLLHARISSLPAGTASFASRSSIPHRAAKIHPLRALPPPFPRPADVNFTIRSPGIRLLFSAGNGILYWYQCDMEVRQA